MWTRKNRAAHSHSLSGGADVTCCPLLHWYYYEFSIIGIVLIPWPGFIFVLADLLVLLLAGLCSQCTSVYHYLLCDATINYMTIFTFTSVLSIMFGIQHYLI